MFLKFLQNKPRNTGDCVLLTVSSVKGLVRKISSRNTSNFKCIQSIKLKMKFQGRKYSIMHYSNLHFYF